MVVVVVGGELETEEGVGGEYGGERVVQRERRGGLGVERERWKDLREAVGGEEEEEILEDEAVVDRVADGVEISGIHHQVGESSPTGPKVGKLGNRMQKGRRCSLIVFSLPNASQHIGTESVTLFGFKSSA